MQRPVMDPTFVKDQAKAKRRGLPLLRWTIGAARWLGRSLLSNPLVVQRPDDPKRPSLVKVGVRMLVSWAVFLPLLTVGSAVTLVWLGTHPKSPPAITDPNSQACYFDPVSFASEDGAQLSAWLIPVIDAKRILLEKERVFHSRRPAIVLVHDYSESAQQMLPLVRPLHDEGVVVLDVSLRGSGSQTTGAQTFGLNEAKDIAAAVALLRHSTFVDPQRIAVAGIGTGANAALIAASRDSNIAAVVIFNPIKDCDAAIIQWVAPRRPSLNWMEPLCRRVFEVMYGVHAEDLTYDHYASVLKSRPTMLFTGDSFVLHEANTINEVRAFCRRQLRTQEMPTLGTAR